MKKQIKLSIPNPCQEDWNKMTENPSGRFCAICNKNVVDFTKMSDDELKNYFLNYKGNSICGKFKKDQLETSPVQKRNKIQLYFINLHKHYSRLNPSFNKFLLIAFLNLALLLCGCKDSKQKVNDINNNGTDNKSRHSGSNHEEIGEIKPIRIDDDSLNYKMKK